MYLLRGFQSFSFQETAVFSWNAWHKHHIICSESLLIISASLTPGMLTEVWTLLRDGRGQFWRLIFPLQIHQITALSICLSIFLNLLSSVFFCLIELYVTQHPSVLCRQLKTNTVQIKLLHAMSEWLTECAAQRVNSLWGRFKSSPG